MPENKSLPFKLGAATFRGISLFFNALYEVMMDHDKSQGHENKVPHQQSSASPTSSSDHDLKTPQERYSMDNTLSMYEDLEDPQEPYSIHTTHQQLEDLQIPSSIEIRPRLYNVHETAKDSTERRKNGGSTECSPEAPSVSKDYMHENSDEYPNGYVQIERRVSKSVSNTDARSVGWAMLVYGHRKLGARHIYNKSCLGVYQCPKCEYIERPRIPESGTKRIKHTLPRPAQSPCPKHGCDLDHVPCLVTMRVVQDGETVTFNHNGFHNHAIPHPVRADIKSKKQLETLVKTASEVLPKQLLLGSMTRDSVRDIHPVYANLDRLAYERGKILKGTSIGDTFSAMTAFEEHHGMAIIRSSSISNHDGHISIQTDFMKEKAASIKTCMQSDSVHGFIIDDHFHDVNVTFTTALCPVIQRTVPLVITIMFGKTQIHYQAHFQVLLKSLPFKTWQEFVERFPGMTCDFSDAERAGFESALRTFYNVVEHEELQLENHYHFCEVHFKRSLTRVRRNGAIVPHFKEMEFYNTALQLLDPQHTRETFAALISQIRHDYPKANEWIKWHLNSDRGKHIFPALTSGDFSHLSKDTNAQESLGGDFQKLAAKRKLSITETFQHSFLYVNMIEAEHGLADRGMAIRYKRHKKKAKLSKVFHNDGRAPDTTKALLHRTSAGRPRGSRNKIPKLGSDIDWKTFGIPWSFSYNDFKATNTCPLDTPLMSWYLLNRFSEAILPAQVQETNAGLVLSDIMADISSERYDRARWLWCTQIQGLSGVGVHNLWNSMEEAFLKYVPGLVRLTATVSSKCSSPLCPEPCLNEREDIRELVIHNPRQINQLDFDESLIPGDGPCTVHVSDALVLEHGEDSFRFQACTDVDTGETLTWYACRGHRTRERMQFSTLPYLLVLNCLENWNRFQDCPIQNPARVLHINDNEYHLAAIMYGGQGHFCCTTMIKSGSLFYDGMKSKKLQWLKSTGNDLEIPNGFQMNQVWFLKNNTHDVFSDQAPSTTLGPIPKPIAAPSSRPLASVNKKGSDRHSSSDSWDARVIDHRSTAEPHIIVEGKRRRKPQYPMGLSLGEVGLKGRVPTCVGCRQDIKRGSKRLLLTKVVNEAKFWTTTASFHLKEDCIRVMSREDQSQARILISPPVLLPNQMSGSHSSQGEKQQVKRKGFLRELSSSLGPAWTHKPSPRKGYLPRTGH